MLYMRTHFHSTSILFSSFIIFFFCTLWRFSFGSCIAVCASPLPHLTAFYGRMQYHSFVYEFHFTFHMPPSSSVVFCSNAHLSLLLSTHILDQHFS